MVISLILIYLGVGFISAILLAIIFISGDEFHNEEPIIKFLALATIISATLLLWPIFLTLLIFTALRRPQEFRKSFFPQLRNRKTQIKEHWLAADAAATLFNAKVDKLLSSEDLDLALEIDVRNSAHEFDRLYDSWRIEKQKFLNSTPTIDAVQKSFLAEGDLWPDFKISIELDFDEETQQHVINHTTTRRVIKYSNIRAQIISPLINFSEIKESVKTSWQVAVSKKFERSIKKVNGEERRKLEAAIAEILISPLEVKGNTKAPLSKNRSGTWRYRFGDWRVIYSTDPSTEYIILLDYQHRSNAYNKH